MNSWRVVSPGIALVTALAIAVGRPAIALAGDGAGSCDAASPQQAGILAGSNQGTLIGGRASVEGQVLALCHDTGDYSPSGSFHWAAVQIADPNGNNIVQVGYGRCQRTDNLSQWGTTNCNGNLYRYWAWGSDCGAGVAGSGGSYGPIPMRIGPVLSSPPAIQDFFVIRETVNGQSFYDAYVNGALLQGTDARGQQRVARVLASSVCWNASLPGRSVAWFGEVFNDRDSMGGWNTDGTQNHLDYTTMRFSIATGWKSPGLSNPCGSTFPQFYACSVVGDHMYVDTIGR